MKRIALMVLAGVIMLSAVEWETEQVTNEPYLYSLYPVIAFLPDGKPLILFEQSNDEDYFYVKKAHKAGDSWVAEELLDASDIGTFRFDIDSEGNMFIAFCRWMDEQYDLFLATDTSGEIVVHQLTDDESEQYWPVIHLDQDENPRIVYMTTPPSLLDAQPFYGYFDEQGFHSEQIAEWTDFSGFDYVLDANGLPHIFYIYEGNVWHTYRSTLSAYPDWPTEMVAESSIDDFAYGPSAAIDAEGRFHVAYELSGSPIGYATNKGGSWHSEYVWSEAEDPRVNEDLAIDVDPQGNPHLAWGHAYDMESQYDIYYGTKLPEGWSHEPVTNTPDADEFWPEDHFFRIDAQGYGHMVYAPYEYETEQVQIYYAKSKEPLISISESPTETEPLDIEVRSGVIYFNFSHTGSIRLDLYDAVGRHVDQLASGNYPAGEHTLTINTTGLSAGVYFVRGELNGRSASDKFVFAR